MDKQRKRASNTSVEKEESYRWKPKRRKERKRWEEEERDEVSGCCRRRIQKEKTWDRKDKMRAEVKLEDGWRSASCRLEGGDVGDHVDYKRRNKKFRVNKKDRKWKGRNNKIRTEITKQENSQNKNFERKIVPTIDRSSSSSKYSEAYVYETSTPTPTPVSPEVYIPDSSLEQLIRFEINKSICLSN